jgi:beta-lactamase regulating signal transducer with metallopeptidase domain
MIGWAIEALAASTLLMLVVLAVRGPVARRFGAQAAYMLWLLPALRMILPRLPEAAQRVKALPIHIDVARLVATATLAREAASEPVPSAVASRPPFDWTTVGLALWLGGAAAYLAWQLGRHHRFMSIALEKAGPGTLRGGIRVRLSPVVSGPLAAGIFHRHILLPEDFEQRYSGAEQRLALAHELAHHRRGDLIANGAALAMLALHWFNPIAHWAYRAFRSDQELACDATVLGAAPESRADYGRALIKSARAGMPETAACALGPATELKRRITMIANSTGNRTRRIAGAALATVLVGIGLGLTASGSIAAPSRLAPASVKPLFRATPQPQVQVQAQPEAKPIMLAARDDGAQASDQDKDEAADAPAPPAAPAQLAAPLPPVPPSGAPPLPPAPPMAAMPPVPPMPPIHAGMSPADRREMERALRHAGEEGRRAGEEARRAVAHMDFAAITRDAMAQARAELQRNCTHAKPGPAGESDSAAIARLSTGCVDMMEINREVQAALREAAEEIRSNTDLSDADRARALAAIDHARMDMAHRFAQ